MKILCDNCGAKYSIADEKVAGRVFKIRCKKCTNIIAVRGDQVAAPEAEEAPAAFDYGSDQVWHVVVDGDQQGPFAPSQLGGMLTDGTIDWEAYVWKEDFDGWKPARDVPELVAAITGEAPEEEAAPLAAAAAPLAAAAATPAAAAPPLAAADPFGGAEADPFGGAAAPADPFSGADADPFSGADPFGGTPPANDDFGGGFGEAARSGGDAGADLFAGGADSGFGASDGVVASTPSPRVSADQAMTGQRNENSVLFSLSNLQALATGGSGDSSSSSPGGGLPPSSAGHASGEGSGLIDIRALASASAATSGSGGLNSPSAAPDDLLSIGGGVGLGPALGAPVLAPAAAEPEKSNKGLLIGGGIAAMLVIGLLVALIVVLTKEPAEQVSAANVPSQTGTAAPAAPAAAGDPAAPAAAEPATPAVPAEGTGDSAAEGTADGAEGSDEDGAEEGSDEPASSRGTSRRRNRNMSGRGSAMSNAAAATTPPPSMMTTMRPSSSNSDIDDLLNGALGGGSMRTAMMAAAAMSNLPPQPGRSDVGAALRRVSSRAAGCGNGTSGVAQAAIVFASSGRVRSVRVTGVPPAIQSCVARTVRSARVPPFSRPTFNVNFPFRVR